MAHGVAFLAHDATEGDLVLVQRGQRLALADKGAKLGHLGDDHGHDLKRVELIVGILPRFFRLHDKDAQAFAQPLDRHAEKRAEAFLAGLRHVAKALLGRRVRGVDRARAPGDAAHQPLTQPHACDMHRFGCQALGRAQLKRVGIAQKVDRAHLRAHRIGDQMGDPVEPFLTRAAFGHGGLQARQELAAFAIGTVRHRYPGLLTSRR